MISKILSFDWALWFFWIMATNLGWFLGGLIFSGLTFITSGLLIGIFQWLVLQGRIVRPWRWIVSTFSGWTVGYLIMFLGIPREFEIFDGVAIGLTTGIAQWVILRHELHWAGWWIIFSVVGWTTGFTLLPGFMLTGTMAGALTGLALEILLRHPKLTTICKQASNPDRLDLSGRNTT
ncbi:MAG: hypothetical protein MUO77_03985 [Anaerolineales bacterium]|nr:hypothetical protein [Anaerolineales bacterium]